MHRWFNRASVERISQGGLGASLNVSEDGNAPHPYGNAMRAYIPLLTQLVPLLTLMPYARNVGSARFRRWLVGLIPVPMVQRFKAIIDTMDTQARNIYATKTERKSHMQDGGKDIMSILSKVNAQTPEHSRLSEDELLGQMLLLIFAATDTTASILMTAFQLLAQCQDIQDRIKAEILAAHYQYGEEIPYEQLMALPLLDAVCRETLRLHPPVPYLIRQARRDLVLPPSKPLVGKDGTILQEVSVPMNTFIIVAVRGANFSRDIWGDDAEQWKPERWIEPLPASVSEARMPGVFSHMMTFNGGARSCVGYKFSLPEMKVVITMLLVSFKFFPSDIDNDIVWNLAIVRYPTVGKQSDRASLSMTVVPLSAQADDME
ncbi:unnamed protein product [Somion occarium]|uniref:Cytochrome P450 n=1 Tax=Somion occarium TaxID=3059160 RepID=A0ABP1CPQ7_9APHY